MTILQPQIALPTTFIKLWISDSTLFKVSTPFLLSTIRKRMSLCRYLVVQQLCHPLASVSKLTTSTILLLKEVSIESILNLAFLSYFNTTPSLYNTAPILFTV